MKITKVVRQYFHPRITIEFYGDFQKPVDEFKDITDAHL